MSRMQYDLKKRPKEKATFSLLFHNLPANMFNCSSCLLSSAKKDLCLGAGLLECIKFVGCI